MSSQSDLVGGEQNGQTSQPLVANQNHQSPGTDQKCRARKRVNAKNDQNVKSKADGKKKAKSPGKDQRYRARIRQGIEKMERQLEEARKENADLKITNAFSNGKLAQALLDMDLIKGYVSQMKEEVTQNTARVNRLQQLVVAGTINQFGATMEPGGLVLEESLAPGGQGNNSEQPTPYNADQFPGVN